MTTVGLIVVMRVYLLCQTCRLGLYAADPVLGLSGFLSRRLRQLTSLLGAAATSFAKAADLLWQCAGVRISEEVVRQCCLQTGKQLEPCQGMQPAAGPTATGPTFRDAAGEIEFQVDAVKVNTVDHGWKDLK